MNLWEGVAVALISLLSVADGAISCERIRKYGIAVELNPFVTWMATMFGPKGVYAATLIPTAISTVVFLVAHSHLGLGIVLGIRMCLYHFQRISKRLETEIDELEGRGR